MAVKNSQILQPSTSLPDSAQNTSSLFDNNSVGRLSFNPVNVNPLRRGLTRHSLRERSGSPDLHQVSWTTQAYKNREQTLDILIMYTSIEW